MQCQELDVELQGPEVNNKAVQMERSGCEFSNGANDANEHGFK